MIKPRIKGPNPEPPEAGTDAAEQVIAAPTGTTRTRKGGALWFWGACAPTLSVLHVSCKVA